MIQKTKRSITREMPRISLRYCASQRLGLHIWVKTIINGIKKKHIGTHLIADFWYGENIEDPKELEEILLGAVKISNHTLLKIAIHKFEPYGITGIVLLAESHIAIHNWPELSYTAIDIYTCGDKSNADKALEFLKKELKPRKVKLKKMKRGILL